MTSRIDAHQHFWNPRRGDYGWLTPAVGPIYRDFMPEDLAPTLTRLGIDGTILVQAAPTVAETIYMLDIAANTPFVAGVVGWVDFTAPDAPDMIARLARDPLLVGLRPMIHDIADDDWMLRDDLAPALHAMTAHGLVFDALVRPRHLPRLARFVTRYPNLAVVIDHGAKPDIRNRAQDDRAALRLSARHVQALWARHRSGRKLDAGRRAAVLRGTACAVRPKASPVRQRLACREPRGRL